MGLYARAPRPRTWSCIGRTALRAGLHAGVVAALLASAAACTAGGNWYLHDGKHSEEAAPDALVTEVASIFVTRDPLAGRLYQDLGLLRVRIGRLATASVLATREDLDQELRKAAAKLGANAVVNVHYDTRTLPELRALSADATGTAVKFMD